MARRALGPATLAVVQAVDAALGAGDRALLVACSGGADSLALALAARYVADRRALPCAAVVVDHGLQPASADVARQARDVLTGIGFADVQVVPVQVARDLGPRTGGRGSRGPLPRAARAGPGRICRRPCTGHRPAGPHPGRPGRDGPAGAHAGLRPPVARRDGPPIRHPAPAPAGADPPLHRGRLRRGRAERLAGPAQRGPGLRPRPGAHPRAAGARGRARTWDRRSPRPDRVPGPRGRGPPRRPRRRGGPGHGGAALRGAAAAAGRAAAPGTAPVAACPRRRRPRPHPRARRGGPGDAVARAARGAGPGRHRGPAGRQPAVAGCPPWTTSSSPAT